MILRRAAAITDAGVEAGRRAVREGASDHEVCAEVTASLLRGGSEFMCIQPVVAVGHRTGIAHSTASGAVIQGGDPVFLELGACVHRYTAPIMRTVFAGHPSREIHELSEYSSRALDAMIRMAAPGVVASAVAAAGHAVLAPILPRIAFHFVWGYSVGLGFPPSWLEETGFFLEANNHRALQPGMVFHLPLMLRDSGVCGAGHSETILITDQGAEVLSQVLREAQTMTLELRTRIGIVTPDDAVNDDEYWKFVDNDVTLLIDRYRTPQRFDPIGPDMVASYAGLDLLKECSETLRITKPQAVVFFCNSCSFVGGRKANQQICEAMAQSAQAPATTVSSAQVEALKCLGVRRISVGAPYRADVTAFLVAFLEEHGFEVVASHSLGMTAEWEIGNSPPSTWEKLAHDVDRDDADAVLLACTGIRTSPIIERVETDLRKPLVTAPAAGIWHALRLGGYQRISPGRGMLFQLQLRGPIRDDEQ